MEFRQLRYAVRVAQTLHFGRAADLEHIAPSVLSTQLRRLELELGVSLFDRSASGVVITQAGAHFVDEANSILDSLHVLKMDTRSVAGSATTRLRIGFFGEALGELTHLLFDSVSETHPHAELAFTELSMNNQFELLHSGVVDAAFIRLPVDDPALCVTPLFQEPLRAATSARGEFAGLDSVSIEDILDRPFAVAGGGTPASWSSYWSLDAERGERSRVGAAVTTLPESLAAVAYTDIVDTFPESAARKYRHPGVDFLPISDAEPSTLALVSRKGNTNPLVESLRECTITLVRQYIGMMPGAESLLGPSNPL
ncbi:LysR family transcriptional regulator [Parafrigoribacterium humi]|jgi:DNA-binding transcriptional LysR family regulator|uniref:LysR family transcriptional regulator n=1 Tax=Parafrigoribacterium humi TaxID=3144664 RepID=UPI0032F004EA